MALRCINCPDCGARAKVILFTVDMADRVAGFSPQHLKGFSLLGPITQMKRRFPIC